jgi:hypothetical protein
MVALGEPIAMRPGIGKGDDAMFDVYMLQEDALLVGRPAGTLDVRMAEEVVDLVEIKEILMETGFNRFCDLTRLDGIRLSTIEVHKLAERRRAFNPNDVHVKTAFLATDPLAFGVARMYEQLLDSSRIEVRVCRDVKAAADWLGVEMGKLTL